MLGSNIGLNYRNWDFGQPIWYFWQRYLQQDQGSLLRCERPECLCRYAGKAWSGEGTSTDILALANDTNQNYTRVSSFYVEDGSYLRVKLMQLGYTLPKKLVGGMDLRLSSRHRIRSSLPVTRYGS